MNVSSDDLLRVLLRRNFHAFVKHFWRFISPFPLVDDWYVRVICLHLQLMVIDNDPRVRWASEGNNLLINLPPRTGKSKILSVLFIAWAWAVDPKLRFVTASYSKEFAGRDSKETRTLMETNEYRRLFPDTRLKSGQNLAHRYYTTAGGYRVTMSVDSGTTGEGGDIQVFDDPHDVSDSVSKRKRDYAVYYFKKIFFNRTETPTRARRIVCGQRVHAQDISSDLIKSTAPTWVHLCLPEEFDARISKKTPIFTDPRLREGDLLRPDRFGKKEIDEAKGPHGMGARTYAAVYQQQPMDDEGGMFQRRWFDDKILTHFPADVTNWIRYWDLACTESSDKSPDPDFTSGTLGGSSQQYPFVIGDVVRDRLEQPAIDRLGAQVANMDALRFQRKITQYYEAVAGFKAVVQHMIHGPLRGYPVFPVYITKGFDKRARAVTLQACAEAGGVWMVTGKWIPDFLEELCTFGGFDEKGNEYSEYASSHDDMVDSTTGCYNQVHFGSAGQLRANADPSKVNLGQGSLMGAGNPRRAALARMAHGKH